MVSNKIVPAHILRLYTWELLSAQGVLDRVNGLIPIVPINEEPILEGSGMPYLVYGWAEQYGGNSSLREIRNGTFSVRICGRTAGELGEITTTISRAFENADTSAKNVNLWSSNYGGDPSGTNPLTGSEDNPFIGIRFTSLDVTYTEGGEAPESEGGMYEGVMNVGYAYVTLQTVKQFRPAGTKIKNPNGTYSTTTIDEWV